MPKVRQAQSSFHRGEFSPYMAARSDVPTAYNNGAAALLNFMPLAQGGVRVRPGFRYLATFPAWPVRLVDFLFNDSQRYVLAFSDARLDIYGAGGTLLQTILGTPWTAAMLPQLGWAHYGDTTFLFHIDMPQQVLLRTGATSFSLSAYAFEQHSSGAPMYQPYNKYAAAAMTLTPSATTGAITMTLSGAGRWAAGHIGTIVRYKKKEILVTGVTSATVAAGTVRETLAGTGADADWDEQTFSPVAGYPGCGELFSNRLCLARGRSLPAGFWASKVGAYFNFDLGTQLDNEAIWDTITGSRIAEIRHLLGGRHLLIFTDQALFYVPTSDTRPFTPKNVAYREQAPYGANFVRPAQFDGAAIFCQRTGTVVREALWADTEQAYSSNALSLLAEHLIRSPTEMAVLYGRSGGAEQYAIFVNGDGKLSVLHSVRDQEIAAWVPWQTDGVVRSIAAVGEDVFLAVERELNGVTVGTLEILSEEVYGLDCAVKVAGAASRSWAGFAHLANETVRVMSNGHYLGVFAVSAGGTITLNDQTPEVTELAAGFWTAPVLAPMPIDFDFADGKARGLMKSLIRALVQVDRSFGFRLQGSTILMDFEGDDFAMAPSSFTGIVEIRLRGISRECPLELVVENPASATILGLTREVQVNG